MDGWMTWEFSSFATVLQSYQDNDRLIMKGCVQWSSVYGLEDFASIWDRTRSARSVGHSLTHWATGVPIQGEKMYFQENKSMHWSIGLPPLLGPAHWGQQIFPSVVTSSFQVILIALIKWRM